MTLDPEPALHPADALPSALLGDPHAALLAPFLPRLARWRADLRAGMAVLQPAHEGLAFDADALEEPAVTRLARQWLWIATPTLVLEMHCAKALGELAGDTPEARWRSFVERLATPGCLDEYQVLEAQLEDRARQNLDSTLELLSRLVADRDEIRRACFDGRDPGPLVGLESRAGDPHADGRSVALLTFGDGSRLVYKPRPLAVDARFQRLLAWFGQRGAPEPFRTLTVLDRGDYGWMEFVSAAPCADAAALSRYHVRLGALLAVLHLVRAVDLHFENLVAAGEHPVPVDLETLFHPTPPSVAARPAAERAVTDALDESVLRVGLLPYRVGNEAGFAEADLSGLAPAADRVAPDQVIRWENVGRDDMRAVKVALPLEGADHRPTLDGSAADPSDFAGEIADGLARMGAAILRHRAALGAPGGELERFAEDRVRVILRPSRVYGLLLDACWHPDLLRTREPRDRFFARLGVASDAPELAAALPFESRDLWAGDVPLFTTRAGSRDLWSSRGQRIPEFFAESPLEAARRRLATWTSSDLERETWLVRACLAMDALNRDRGRWITHEPELPAEPPAAAELRARLIEAARGIGGWFDRMAVGDTARATWVALDFRAMQWTVNAAAIDLYSGIPGIVLFLAHLGSLAGDPSATRLARRGLRAFLERLDHADGPPPGRGLFQGIGGAIYTLAHLAALWGEPSLREAAESMLDAVERSIDDDDELDVVAGGAGVIAALLSLDAAGGSPRALELAARCGRHLVGRSEPHPQGRIWRLALSGDDPATGFAHGTSGIACALLQLAARTGDRAALDCALLGLRAESAVLEPQLTKWADDPVAAEPASLPRHAERTLSTSWCHGLAGLALARHEAAAHDDGLAREAAAFLARTRDRGFGRSHCLCHGDVGNLDILARAARVGTETREVARRVAGTLEGAAETGWRCGTMSEVEAPGLMNGLAGIGYGLLRLADPERVPSVLALDPPRA